MSFKQRLKFSFTMTRFEFSWKMIPESRSHGCTIPLKMVAVNLFNTEYGVGTWEQQVPAQTEMWFPANNPHHVLGTFLNEFLGLSFFVFLRYKICVLFIDTCCNRLIFSEYHFWNVKC